LWAYQHTGYDLFLQRAKNAIRMTMDAYPDQWRWTNGIAQERARMLLPLAWLVRVDDRPEHREWLRRMAKDLLALQDPCGAIREELGPPGRGSYGPPRSNEEYGKNEATLMQANGDPLCDLLYTTNFAFLGLHEAAAATGQPLYREAEDKLARFLCRIQIRSESHPELDGGWFRAFDFNRWEYWASNADLGWGAWSIESGWTQGWIVAVLGLRDMKTSLWDLTAATRIKRHLVKIEALMFPANEKASGSQRVEHQAANFRRPATHADLKYWLENMIWYHRFTPAEITAATGLQEAEIAEAVKKFNIKPGNKPSRPADAPLLVLPYPGGRHPRIGFLDGAICPQRETKVSVFMPWNETSYVVVDVPEAIWSNLGLTYLAHTHVPTLWTKKGIELPTLEWERHMDGSLESKRTLPSGIAFGTKVVPTREAVRMEMWLTNGTDKKLTDLRVQNCVMTKGTADFDGQTNENKVFAKPYAACRSADGKRWIITAWDPCHRTWANDKCPCFHSDPKFPDCAPGETKRLDGWLSFYEGADIRGEFRRIEQTGWRRE
jgi:hypothetical protein